MIHVNKLRHQSETSCTCDNQETVWDVINIEKPNSN